MKTLRDGLAALTFNMEIYNFFFFSELLGSQLSPSLSLIHVQFGEHDCTQHTRSINGYMKTVTLIKVKYLVLHVTVTQRSTVSLRIRTYVTVLFQTKIVKQKTNRFDHILNAYRSVCLYCV